MHPAIPSQTLGGVGAAGPPPARYRAVIGEVAIEAQIRGLLNSGESARNVLVHLTDHGQYPEGEIISAFTRIQTAVGSARIPLRPSQAVLLPLHGHINAQSIRYVVTLLKTKYGADNGSIHELFRTYNYPPVAVNTVINQQLAALLAAVSIGADDRYDVGDVLTLAAETVRAITQHGSLFKEGIIMRKWLEGGVVRYQIDTCPHNMWTLLRSIVTATKPGANYGTRTFRNPYIVSDLAGSAFGGTGGATIAQHPPPGPAYGHAGHVYAPISQATLNTDTLSLFQGGGTTPEELTHDESHVRARYERHNYDPAQVTLAIAYARTAIQRAAPPVIVQAVEANVDTGGGSAAVVPAPVQHSDDVMGVHEDPHTFSSGAPADDRHNVTHRYGRPGHIYNVRARDPTVIYETVLRLMTAMHMNDADVRRAIMNVNWGPPSVVTEAIRRGRIALSGTVTFQAAAPPAPAATAVGPAAAVVGTTSVSARRVLTVVPPFATWVAAQDTRLRDELGEPPTDPVLEARWVTRARAIYNAEQGNAPAAPEAEGPVRTEVEGEGETCPDGSRRRMMGGGSRVLEGEEFDDRGCAQQRPTKRVKLSPEEGKAGEGGGSGAVLLAAAVAVGVLVAKFS